MSTTPNWGLTNISTLRSHEETDTRYLEMLLNRIEVDGYLKRPIVADNKYFIVLDGEHRFQALKRLDCRLIPTIFLDYMSNGIIVLSRRRKYASLNKEQIIHAALSHKLFPPKTTKHMIFYNGRLRHVSSIERHINIPLEKLSEER